MIISRIVRVEPNRETDHTEKDAQKITALVICEGVLDGVNEEVFEYGINPKTPTQIAALEKKISQAKEMHAEDLAAWKAFEARRLAGHAAWQAAYREWQEELENGNAKPEDEPIYQAPIPLVEPVYIEPRDISNENRVRMAVQEWLDDGGVIPEYIPPTAEELREAMEPISGRQLRHGLLSVLVYEEDIDAIIAAIPDEDERRRADIDWRTADEYERTNPLVVSIGETIGQTPEQIDSLWGFFQTI